MENIKKIALQDFTHSDLLVETVKQDKNEFNPNPFLVEDESKENELVNEAIDDHLQKMVEDDEQEVVDGELSEDQEVKKKDELVTLTKSEIEEDKVKEFERGYAQAKKELEELHAQEVSELKKQVDLKKIITEKLLESENLLQEYQAEIVNYSQAIIALINEKLALNYPTNIEQKLNDMIEELLSKNLKADTVSIKINQLNKELLEKIIAEEMSEELRAKIEIKIADELSENDCLIHISSNTIFYSRDKIVEQINKIINDGLPASNLQQDEEKSTPEN